MAQDLGSKDYMKEFDKLSSEEQQKLIGKLQKKQKGKIEKPKTSRLEGYREKGGAGSWD